MLVEMGDCLVGLAAAQRQHVDGRQLQVRRHAHLGHGERVPAQHLVDDLATEEDVGKGVADQLAHFQLALRKRLAPRFSRSPMGMFPDMAAVLEGLIGGDCPPGQIIASTLLMKRNRRSLVST